MSLLVIACAAFGIGLYGVLSRRDIVAVLASVEVMLGGALLLLVGVGYATARGGPARMASVQGVGLMVLVVIAAEAAVGLALLVTVTRQLRTTRLDELTEVRG